MTKKGPWYRSLSTPSQVLLVVFLALCLFFGIGVFRQFDEYLASLARLEQTQARLAGLEKKGERLEEARRDIDREKESLVRDGLGARPGDTVFQLPPNLLTEQKAEQASASADAPFWQQWWDLFFSPE